MMVFFITEGTTLKKFIQTASTALLILLIVDLPAAAETNSIGIKSVVTKLLDEASDCDVGRLDVLSLGTSPAVSNNWSSLWFTGIQTEGCGGGNNYGYSVSVHEIRDGSARNVAMDDLGFPWIESIQEVEIKGTPVIKIVASDYGPEDARCCPSLMREVRIWAESDRVVWKNIKTWTKR